MPFLGLWVCGENKQGQLGLGDNEIRYSFTELDWPAEHGRICQVVAGWEHTLVLTNDDQLWGCGSGDRLGLGASSISHYVFTKVDWPAERGRIRQIIAGNKHTLVLTDDHRLWGCGSNKEGQLGLGDKITQVNHFTEVPWLATCGQIKQVFAGGNVTFVLSDDHRLWGCGYNSSGQLGLGDQVSRTTFTAVPWSTTSGRIRQVVTGSHRGHTLVLTEDNRLWGCGFSRNVGLGEDIYSGPFKVLKFEQVKNLQTKALQQVSPNQYFKHNIDRLIKLGQSLTSASGTASDTLHNQHQLDESEGQTPVKSMRL